MIVSNVETGHHGILDRYGTAIVLQSVLFLLLILRMDWRKASNEAQVNAVSDILNDKLILTNSQESSSPLV